LTSIFFASGRAALGILILKTPFVMVASTFAFQDSLRLADHRETEGEAY
jgi:hypothetical protein